jgi:GTP cyclohydrolase I
VDTPKRIVKSWEKLFGGYRMDPEEILAKVFTEDCDQMVMLREIEFYSMCEHHMLPFTGKASVAYIPDGKVVGVSKLARLVECYSRRLQVQERMTNQIAGAVMKYLHPKGAGVVVSAKHLCMVARGVEKQQSTMVTSALHGVLREDERARREFLGLVG